MSDLYDPIVAAMIKAKEIGVKMLASDCEEIVKAAIASMQGEAVEWQFYESGKWFNFMDDNHRQNTIKAGYQVRPLFTYQPSASAEIARLTKELEEARKDAERYNWLCDTCVDFEEVSEGDGYTVKSLHFEYSPKMFLHEAIDQAMLSAAPDAAISKIGGGE